MKKQILIDDGGKRLSKRFRRYIKNPEKFFSFWAKFYNSPEKAKKVLSNLWADIEKNHTTLKVTGEREGITHKPDYYKKKGAPYTIETYLSELIFNKDYSKARTMKIIQMMSKNVSGIFDLEENNKGLEILAESLPVVPNPISIQQLKLSDFKKFYFPWRYLGKLEDRFWYRVTKLRERGLLMTLDEITEFVKSYHYDIKHNLVESKEHRNFYKFSRIPGSFESGKRK